MIERSLEELDGIIFVRAGGVWTVDEVTEHYDALGRMVEDLRKAGRPVRVLSDIREAPRQLFSIEKLVRSKMDSTFEATDRVAIVTGNENDSIYLRSLLSGAQIAAFTSQIAAEIWLMLDDEISADRLFRS